VRPWLIVLTLALAACDGSGGRLLVPQPEPASDTVVVAAPLGTLVIDNGAAGFASRGAWASVHPGGLGDRDFLMTQAGSGAAARWQFPPRADGGYRLRAYVVPLEAAAASATYRITSERGESIARTIDLETARAPGWVELGEHALAGVITVELASDDASAGFIVADAIELAPIP
jgi:hypothetical protein